MRDLDVDELEQVAGASHCKSCPTSKDSKKAAKKAEKYTKKAEKYAAKGDCKKAGKYAAKAGIHDFCC